MINTENTYSSWMVDEDGTENNMENNHIPHWQKVLSYILEEDLSDKSILDFGCNQGGFLRFLYSKRPFKQAVGVDLAKNAIETANNRKNNLPIDYINTGRPDTLNTKFDLALSMSVIYLIEDLDEHAKIINKSLNNMGVYYTSYTDYNGNPNLPYIFKTINKTANVKMQLHSLDDIAKAFINNGFKAEIIRLIPKGFIPLDINEDWQYRLSEKMQYEYEQGYIFRFTKINNI